MTVDYTASMVDHDRGAADHRLTAAGLPDI